MKKPDDKEMDELIDCEILRWIQDNTRIQTDCKAHRELVLVVTGLVEKARGGTRP